MNRPPILTTTVARAWAAALVLLGGAGVLSSACTSVDTDPPALVPAVLTEEWAVEWWLPRHQQKLEDLRSAGRVDLVMIGDSITFGWETNGAAVWEEHYGARRAFNLGFGGDRTEQVLWRLAHGAVDGIEPRLVILLIGTNNTGHRRDPPAETAAGVEAILDDLAARLPGAEILLLAILPRADDPELRTINEAVNARIAKLADGERVHFLDVGEVFLGEDGALRQDLMPDLLHPNEEGYRRWAAAMEPTVRELMGETAR